MFIAPTCHLAKPVHVIKKHNSMKKILAIVFIISFLGCQQKKAGKIQKPEKDDWWLWTASWSPNSDELVVGGTQDTLRLFSTKDFFLRKNYPFIGTITKAKWHPTKNKLAISVQGGKSKPAILNLDTEKITELDSISIAGARAIGWNNEGDLLAVGDYEGLLVIFNEDGNFVKKIDTGQKGLIGLNWHPKKNLIAAVGERIAIYNFDDDTLVSYEDREKDVLMLCVEWHPSGDFFVTGDYGDFEYHYPPLLQFWTKEGKNIKSIEKSKAEYRNLKWSNDGELLATASENIRLWNKDGILVAEKKSENLLWGIDWSSEGDKIVTTDGKGSIIIWDKDLNQREELKY